MFFPLYWLFDYIWVGKACIYGALTECEPVQLKCLQANAQSHKAVPLGLFHSSTRLLMIAMCLPWREGPSARPWHMPGNFNWGRVVCVKFATKTSFQRKSGGMWEKKKIPGWLQMPPLKISRPYYFQTNLLTWDLLFSWPLGPAAQIGSKSGFCNLGRLAVVCGKAGRLKCKASPWRDSTGSDWLAGLSDQTCHTCLGHWCRCSRSALTVVINRWQLTV